MSQENSLLQFQQAMLDKRIPIELPGREDELDLILTDNEFIEKMENEECGTELLYLLEYGEWQICEHMKLIHGYVENESTKFSIPSWLRLVAHLLTVHKA